MSLVGFKAKNHQQQVSLRGADDGVDERITPPEIFDPLHAEHCFTLDAAANSANAKCAIYCSIDTDGLIASWEGHIVWCNPPYSACGAWVEKAYREVFERKCPKAVLLLPANRAEQRWWQQFIEPRRDNGRGITTQFIAGRRRFGWPAGRVVPPKGDRPPFGLVIVIMENRP